MGERNAVMQLIKRTAEHYDVQEVPLGRDYRWSPEQVLLECSKCAKRATYKRSEILDSKVISCECGKANTARVREELAIRLLDEDYEAHRHPWLYDIQEQAKQHLPAREKNTATHAVVHEARWLGQSGLEWVQRRNELDILENLTRYNQRYSASEAKKTLLSHHRGDSSSLLRAWWRRLVVAWLGK
jgi:hypothetical protein